MGHSVTLNRMVQSPSVSVKDRSRRTMPKAKAISRSPTGFVWPRPPCARILHPSIANRACPQSWSCAMCSPQSRCCGRVKAPDDQTSHPLRFWRLKTCRAIRSRRISWTGSVLISSQAYRVCPGCSSSRNTTFTYKRPSVDVRRVVEELGVLLVLEGSVRRSGKKVRVTAQLIDGVTGGQLWSERYDGQLQDVFDLQDEITRNVVASMQTTVLPTTIEEPVERDTRPDLTVWELTMRAWHLPYDFMSKRFDTAKALLERALALGNEGAEANMVLSLINHHVALMGHAADTSLAMVATYVLGRRAIQLDNRNENTRWALGISCRGLHKHDESIVALECAVVLNPNCSVAYGRLGTAYALGGRIDEAIENQHIAIRSNPRDPSIFFRFSGVALAHYMAGRYETAIEWAERAIDRMPRWHYAQFILAASHEAFDQHALAVAAVKACQNVLPEISLSDLEHMPLIDPQKMHELRDCLRRAGFSN